jgi:hypothetical protein
MNAEAITNPRGRLQLVTTRLKVRCTCAAGHVFVEHIYRTIDIDTDPGALDDLTDSGLQQVRCPECDTAWPLAEPLTLHTRQGGRFALLVPDPLAHQELHLRAELMREVADADPGSIPPYVAEFQTLVGTRALKYWLFGPSARALQPTPSREPPAEEPAPAAASEPPVTTHVDSKPVIHEAFADLMGPDGRPSSIPPEPSTDGLDDDPLIDDDWLDDSSLDSRFSRSTVAKEPAARDPGERHAQPPPARSKPSERKTKPSDRKTKPSKPPAKATVDFAGLLTDDEDTGEYTMDEADLAEDDHLELEDEEEIFGGTVREQAPNSTDENHDSDEDDSVDEIEQDQGPVDNNGR